MAKDKLTKAQLIAALDACRKALAEQAQQYEAKLASIKQKRIRGVLNLIAFYTEIKPKYGSKPVCNACKLNKVETVSSMPDKEARAVMNSIDIDLDVLSEELSDVPKANQVH